MIPAPLLVGGVSVRIGDAHLDATVKGRLDQLSDFIQGLDFQAYER